MQGGPAGRDCNFAPGQVIPQCHRDSRCRCSLISRMETRQNISLKPYNTFGIDAKAAVFASFKSIDELQELLTQQVKPKTKCMVLGGGSNVLFSRDYDGIILKNEVPGIEKVKEDDEFVYVRAGAGENWHQLVLHCIKNNWAGIENLSLIPGCVGASPMQNIGAYGVELSEVFSELKAFHLKEKTNYTFALKDCAFGYRDSVFKNKYRDQFAIIHVTFRLRKQPVFNTSYGAIKEELEKMNVTELSIQAISQAVINIRSAKLPDPKTIGNAGSFFKNAEISEEKFLQLRSQFPDIIGHPVANGNIKLASAWLIEQCGWKGFRRGDAGCHEKQALVLVNYGNATGEEILKLSEEIMQSVNEKFGVLLEREVNVV
jgi:UDP-N-acetylmuramate dehydrogenase